LGTTAIDILGLSTFAGNDKGFKSVRGLKATFPTRKESSFLETGGLKPAFPMRKDSTLLETGTFSKQFGSPMAKLEQDSSIVSRTNLSI